VRCFLEGVAGVRRGKYSLFLSRRSFLSPGLFGGHSNQSTFPFGDICFRVSDAVLVSHGVRNPGEGCE
jgi:hypothetical protein